jgi:16S rRNA A1518/A1519 N6-dimethyltransferase RsmA/KsgA/DIM1 with predicted DNA glycosylase/AP lyase activity
LGCFKRSGAKGSSKPNTKVYGIMSVLVQAFYEVDICLTLQKVLILHRQWRNQVKKEKIGSIKSESPVCTCQSGQRKMLRSSKGFV